MSKQLVNGVLVDLTPEQEAEFQQSVLDFNNQKIVRIRNSMVVSRFQARTALRRAGLLTHVQSAIDASTDEELKDAWNTVQEFQRLSPMVLNISQVLNLTDEQLDILFTQSSQIKA